MNYKLKYKMTAYMQIWNILAVDTFGHIKQKKKQFLVQAASKTSFPPEM
jgi:hypothetical protein